MKNKFYVLSIIFVFVAKISLCAAPASAASASTASANGKAASDVGTAASTSAQVKSKTDANAAAATAALLPGLAGAGAQKSLKSVTVRFKRVHDSPKSTKYGCLHSFLAKVTYDAADKGIIKDSYEQEISQSLWYAVMDAIYAGKVECTEHYMSVPQMYFPNKGPYTTPSKYIKCQKKADAVLIGSTPKDLGIWIVSPE